MKSKKQIFALMLCVVLAVVMLPIAVYASDSFDLTDVSAERVGERNFNITFNTSVWGVAFSQRPQLKKWKK